MTYSYRTNYSENQSDKNLVKGKTPESQIKDDISLDKKRIIVYTTGDGGSTYVFTLIKVELSLHVYSALYRLN